MPNSVNGSVIELTFKLSVVRRSRLLRRSRIALSTLQSSLLRSTTSGLNSEGLPLTIVEGLPPAQRAAFEPDLSPEALTWSMHLMRDKAPGPDGLQASSLALLPDCFWDAFSVLWTHIVATGQVPTAWRYNRVCLIRKARGKYRPVGLTAICWRAGARLLVKALNRWVEDWMLPGDVGGLPGRSTLDAHRIIASALRGGAKAFVQEDLSCFYDTIDFSLLVPVLSRMGCCLAWECRFRCLVC